MVGLSQEKLAQLHPGEASVTPLPSDMRRELIALGTLGLLSSVTALGLFIYITYLLLVNKWRYWRERWAASRPQETEPSPSDELENQLVAGASGGHQVPMDLSLGLAESHFAQLRRAKNRLSTTILERRLTHKSKPYQPDGTSADEKKDEDKGSNPMLILIYHVLFADVQVAAAFAISCVWLTKDGIFAPSAACWAQGWMFAAGKLSASFFLVVLSLHSYLGVAKGYRMSRRVIYLSIWVVWILCVTLSTVGIFLTVNGREQGGWFVRSGSWCWVNSAYSSYRIWCEYVWMLLAVAITAVLEVLTLISVWRRGQQIGQMPQQQLPTSSTAPTPSTSASSEGSDYLTAKPTTKYTSSNTDKPLPPQPRDAPVTSGHHPAFFIYPVIYLCCTAPLTFGRTSAMLGGIVPSEAYFSFAGCLMASHGLLNFGLWASMVLLLGPKAMEQTGLDRLTFVRTPHDRKFGNIVWVEGAAPKSGFFDDNEDDYDDELSLAGRWQRWWWRRHHKWPPRLWGGNGSRGAKTNHVYGHDHGIGGAGGLHGRNQRSISEESLQRSMRMNKSEIGIQLEVVTTVVVEDEIEMMSDKEIAEMPPEGLSKAFDL